MASFLIWSVSLFIDNFLNNTEIIGNVSIKDGSGKITLTEIDGNLFINDDSGSISAKGISGNVNIEYG